jgi:hypothetical protein
MGSMLEEGNYFDCRFSDEVTVPSVLKVCRSRMPLAGIQGKLGLDPKNIQG